MYIVSNLLGQLFVAKARALRANFPRLEPGGAHRLRVTRHAIDGAEVMAGDILAAGSMRDGPFGAGDTVEVSLAEIGVLRNRVVAAR